MEEKKQAEQKTMRAVKTVSVEQVVEAEDGRLHLKGIKIAGKEYDLDIHNHTSKEGEGEEKGEGRLDLSFNDGDYVLIIEKDGIRFSRTRYRPDHDHNDNENLLIGVDDKAMGLKKGETIWLSRFPYQGEGKDFFRIPFGAVREDY